MCNYIADVSVLYLRKQHSLHQETIVSFIDSEFESLVENWFLFCSDVRVVSLSEPTFPGDEQHFKVVSSLHARQRLTDWVFSENVCKGLAPANADVALKYEDLGGGRTTSS